ncbi:sugar transferase [Aestuariivirga sp. YIM B02566]|uniref:Sugar transferase n=1 Tax=Taklimakanibacter albus TaxID=2800327 RepID=A0ACC5RAB0_9HYPH|nr:sugar transferase [Aestuariivirga sp. YIM B02566]
MTNPIGRVSRQIPIPSSGFGERAVSIFQYGRRLRVQLVGAIIFAVCVPAVLRFAPASSELLGSATASTLQNAVLGTLIAVLAGIVLLRQFVAFPGVSASNYIIPSFVSSYGAIALVFFFLRLDYSRYQFIVSFAAAITWFYFIYFLTSRLAQPRLAIIPGGEDDRLFEIEGAEWARLKEPTENFQQFDGVVADLRADLPSHWERFIAASVLAGWPVFHVKQVMESLTGRVSIEHLSENSFGSVLPSLLYLRLKRLVDCAAAAVLLPIILPVIALSALMVKIDSKGPMFFLQQRMGYRGRMFTMIKLRSMRIDMPADQLFTAANDPRITTLGRFFRKYRIDELPQIFNVLKGDMSWIGPRPEAVKLASWYEESIPFYAYRHAVRPGITGWAQVSQGNVAEIEAATTKLQYDFYYIKYFSPWLDLLIVLRTIKTILTGFGSR